MAKEIERRRSKRRQVLATFSLFIVVPRKGPLRLPVHDLSEDGIGFDLDIEEEGGLPPRTTSIEKENPLEVHLYLNQSLYLPLHTVIRRVEDQKRTVRRLGAEFTRRQDPAYRGLVAFLALLDALSEEGATAS